MLCAKWRDGSSEQLGIRSRGQEWVGDVGSVSRIALEYRSEEGEVILQRPKQAFPTQKQFRTDLLRLLRPSQSKPSSRLDLPFPITRTHPHLPLLDLRGREERYVRHPTFHVVEYVLTKVLVESEGGDALDELPGPGDTDAVYPGGAGFECEGNGDGGEGGCGVEYPGKGVELCPAGMEGWDRRDGVNEACHGVSVHRVTMTTLAEKEKSPH